MISKINIKDVASFNASDHIMDDLGCVNFIFGANGSGKTTISRVLAHPETYPSCVITWENGQVQKCNVYNSDFVDSTFADVSGMPGIFTLGQSESDVYEKINQTKTQIEKTQKIQNMATIALQGEDGAKGKRKELAMTISQYTDRIWRQKQKYDSSAVRAGLEGFLNSRDRFRDEVIRQYNANKHDLMTRAQLEERASTIFEKKASIIDLIPEPDFVSINSLNSSSILAKKIIGKEDVDIGTLIKKLGNSDWVKSGMEYIDSSDGVCPFCQRTLEDTFKLQLEEYFDESYLVSLQEIEALKKEYLNCSQQLIRQLNGIVQLNMQFVDNITLKIKIAELSKVFDENSRLLEYKRTNASSPVELLDCTIYSEQIIKMIHEANDKITRHNEMVANIDVERKKLTAQIWRFITDEIKSDISDYLSKKANLEREISNLNTEICDNDKTIEELKKNLEQLQRTLTSVIPTRDIINHQLEEFGFTGFRLALGADEHSYSIVRDNNILVEKTLSEGERNFVTFLYFYSLLKGSLDSSGAVYPQVIIIDDPVSSMDSDVLFIVATLIRRLIWDMSRPNTNIQQIFVSTHNLYFHKEVTYNRNWPKGMSKCTKYWITRKTHSYSDIVPYEKNPVKSTYEALWDEVRRALENPAIAEQTSLQNTMRRILEHYFTFYGDISFQNLPMHLKMEDAFIARTLLSWVNDGSHSSFDDFSYTPPMSDGIQRYLNIFALIFDSAGHKAHYNMMMKINEEKIDNAQTENAQP
ncbi:AAA family ATPase [Treponema vincentii]|uniref:AAA family ATPase n=1 Tax=Treponema vincentii TaxID=69710 RepID=UPI003D8BFCFA